MTKGYTTPESDIDALMYFDSDKLAACALHDNFRNMLKHDNSFRERIQMALSLSDRRSVKDIVLKFIDNKKELKDLCVSDEFFYGEKRLAPLFFLSVGHRIDEYRKTVLDALASLGPRGESRWKSIPHSIYKCNLLIKNFSVFV